MTNGVKVTGYLCKCNTLTVPPSVIPEFRSLPGTRQILSNLSVFLPNQFLSSLNTFYQVNSCFYFSMTKTTEGVLRAAQVEVPSNYFVSTSLYLVPSL